MKDFRFVLILALIFVYVDSIAYTISGFGSGGFMATQMHVAFSASISGAGIVAGGPYYCTMGSSSRGQTACTVNGFLINVNTSISYANMLDSDKLIDPVSNLAASKVYIFSGTQDVQVNPLVVQQTVQFYNNFVPASNIFSDFFMNTAHTWPTQLEGNPCWYFGSPYIGACGYDTAGILLQHVYGPIVVKGVFNNSNLFQFDQATYADVWQAGLSTRGWVYAPYACRQNPIMCRMHMFLHGCMQDYDNIGSNLVKNAGYGEWAESNNIIVIFPQTISTSSDFYACWDFIGFTGSNWANKNGLQMAALNNIAQNYTSLVQSLD